MVPFEGPRICDTCGESFGSEYKLRNHRNTVHLNKWYKCHLCDLKTADKQTLEKHINRNEIIKTCSI